MIVTLLEKAYGSFSLGDFEAMIASLCEDLEVKVRVKGQAAQDWILVEITGEDEKAASKLLDQEVGLAPISADMIKKFSILRGKVINSGKSVDVLRLDIGVFEPKVSHAIIPIQRLRAQLADGKDLTLKQLVNLFCLRDFMPVQARIVGSWDSEKDCFEAEFSEAQLSILSDWLRSSLDRLIVLGAGLEETKHAVAKSGHFRDIAKIQTLGPLEHAITCKLGTDAVGLIPSIGRLLPYAYLAFFSPRKVSPLGRLVL